MPPVSDSRDMTETPDIRSQLRSLSIPRENRPAVGVYGRRRKWPFVLLLLIGGLGAAGYYRREQIQSTMATLAASHDARAELKTLRLVKQRPPDPSPVLTATGKIVSDHQVQVATKVSGQIVSLHFEQGDAVQRGQLLARIEDVLYRARRDQAAAELERARTALEFQKVNFARVAQLSESARAASIEYADAVRSLGEGKAAVAAAQALLNATQKALDDCEVTAPIAGVILERNVEVGDFVAAEGGRGANANAQFGTIADMTKLRVEVDISELDIARIRRGMPCIIIPDADKTLRYFGYVMWIDPGANYSKATVQVKVRIDDPDANLRVEGSAQVTFHESPPDQSSEAVASLWVPRAACRVNGATNAATVFVVADGRLRETAVTLGATRGTQVEVTGGLEEGQTIVAEVSETLRDGQRVPGSQG